MLKLQNVGKTYKSKSKQEVAALKDVSLEINDSGLVFILGKSGSGKSTLLNILGGLDSATSGEIFVDGQSLASFKQTDYDNYRNQYVGFVFQEFNLLNDFDVGGNVALALKLSKEKDIDDKVKSALQSVGLSAQYLTRKINELSGGEKQRVAIARAIVKDSKVILADEPTGNLDSATGESIWNILKELSKTKLVIVVTHDRESAEKYGDRIIEISDGKIISDNGNQPETKEQAQTLSAKRKGLPFSVCLKMGAKNLSQRKVKSVSVILLSILTLFVIMLAQTLLCFSSEKTFAKFIKDNDIDYISVMQGIDEEPEFSYYGTVLKPSTLKYIKENANYIVGDYSFGRVEKKQDILDMGLSFVGEAFELDDNSYYITTTQLEEEYKSQYSYVEIDGENVKLIKERHPAQFLVGKRLDISGLSTDYTLAGVVDISSCNSLIWGAFPQYFIRESSKAFHYSFVKYYNPHNIVMQFGKTQYSDEFYQQFSVPEVAKSGGGKIFTERGLQELYDVTLADDEIVLSFDMYSRMFDVSPKWSYVSPDLNDEVSAPPHLGQRFAFKFSDSNSGEIYTDCGELKLVGVVFSYDDKENTEFSHNDDYMPKFATGSNTAKKISLALSNPSILLSVDSIDNLQKFLVNFRSKHDGYVFNVGVYDDSYSSFVYAFEREISLFQYIFLAVAVLLTVIMILLVINLISFGIVSRKKEIGILSALGATNGDITKIFIIETAIIAAITFIVNLAAILIAITVCNGLFTMNMSLGVALMRFDYLTVITLIAGSFGLLLLAALIPLRKIIKLKPIDAIKDL